MISKIKKASLIICLSIILSSFIPINLVNAENEVDVDNMLLVANAGPDRFVKVGSEVIFDASSSSIPSNMDVIYRWDMGNSEFRFGMRNIYIYDHVGVFRVKLTMGPAVEIKELFKE